MTKKHKAPITLKPLSIRIDYDNSWWFSENIEDWIKSKTNLHRKKDKERKQFNRTKGRAQFL